jgi:malonyl CoA-acyl carrier protein transacylase
MEATVSSAPTITAVSYEVDIQEGKARPLLPGSRRLAARVHEIQKSVLTQSLSSLVNDLHEIVGKLPASTQQSELETMSIAIQISAEGGAAMIISGTVEAANSVTLTFKLKKRNTDE